MTEAEWLACDDPKRMLEFLRGRASDRRLRLIAVACCRLLLCKVRVPSRCEHEVDVAERYADGMATIAELQDVRCYSNSVAEHACMNTTEADGGVVMADCAAGNAAWAAAASGAVPPQSNALSPVFNARVAAEQAVQCDLVRDIFGNPFRPVTADSFWFTSTVVSLAGGIYAERAFDRLPLLADALQDAGCDNPDVLAHCRGPGPHVRGCWVIDLLLGKS